MRLCVLKLEGTINHNQLRQITEQCPNLRELSLTPSNWTNPEDIEIIFKNLPELRKIHIQNVAQNQCSKFQTDVTIENLKFLKSFKIFGPFNCIALKDIIKLRYLEELNITKEFIVSRPIDAKSLNCF